MTRDNFEPAVSGWWRPLDLPRHALETDITSLPGLRERDGTFRLPTRRIDYALIVAGEDRSSVPRIQNPIQLMTCWRSFATLDLGSSGGGHDYRADSRATASSVRYPRGAPSTATCASVARLTRAYEH